MALQYSLDTMRAQGIGSPYKSVEEFFIADPANASHRILDTSRTTLGWLEIPGAFLNIKAYQEGIGIGCSGWGVDVSLLPSLFPAVYWFLGIMLIRQLCREPFARFGIHMGVVTENSACHRRRIDAGKRGTAALSLRNQRKILKFQNQMWLAMFYMVSTFFGYCVQRNQPWFKLPLDDTASLHLLLPHPYNPPQELVMYYHYGLAFYFAELFSLFLLERHVKRSDFMEYVVHHITTLLLIVCSHVGLEHRFGAYVLFIHDASDIMLSFSKTLHYMSQEDEARRARYDAKHAKRKDGKTYRQSFLFRRIITETNMNVCFAIFTALFFFFRLWCLPFMGKATIRMAPKVRHGNVNTWMLVFLLNFALQSLHVYWGLLIVVMAVSLAVGGERKDIRSEEEVDEERPSCVHWRFLSETDDEDVEHRKRAHEATRNGEQAETTIRGRTNAHSKGTRRRRSTSVKTK
ncbi:putative mitochondrial dihydroceramide synthase [Leptomonas pyrrhocoris]|uniref:Putative mitochondrial dihydroceramide synthase n=1 Tax=Leptomonas pyrrhocoris TaxID=157538 RepID=A0A0M9FYR1_LEPPY|nr:putative mitochondrial dihydroceramide synthase [Leptomonas pyrrhocoris]XP_015657265.1 putative mitochondrial dihydroceramide synthase [Leptomonas pyrrhocoris]KPA78825.1 putative mitochondrial dihydroceramide synthase [Leptomonas pyrrhocoris]KPA78826.1 putative mitochondrial dihydroceramide synthase [Leptomonas pyrrhocoris]|eukprot:XP_015657264.1 putative mitochondrial dihydroceramide synthase [Leptomonas pyrrhocoris]